MGRGSETFGKKEVRNKQEKKRKDKAQRREERKKQGKKGMDDMIAYVDENGMISSSPPDLSKKKEVKAESIDIGVPKVESRSKSKIRTGKLKTYDEAKGFGFIIDSESNESVFVHRNDSVEPLRVGVKVEFEMEKGIKGFKAINVKQL